MWLLLPAVQSDDSLLGAPAFVVSHLAYYLSDYAAIGNGLTPLADHANHYAHLLPTALAPVLAAFDYSPAALTVVLTVVSGLALLAAFRGLAIASRSELGGLLLYVPFLGIALMPIIDNEDGLKEMQRRTASNKDYQAAKDGD